MRNDDQPPDPAIDQAKEEHNDLEREGWIAEAKMTLDHLSAALQFLDVPHRVNWREWIDQLVEKFSSSASRLQEVENKLRMRLWLGHGHQGLYGDDGEMQCGACRPFGVVDYKREPIEKLEAALTALNLTRLAEQANDETAFRVHETAELRLQEVEAERAWQPIDKWATIPYSSVLLCYFDHGERIVTEGFHDGHNWMDVANQKARKPTHVRELPSPPGRVSEVAGEASASPGRSAAPKTPPQEQP